ncbi:MAG: hypothetical protein MI824_11095, partial [Hyphomicrobiales bacterium]|nr:hypothetical protein [Hyphomicrobiales bacterium]
MAPIRPASRSFGAPAQQSMIFFDISMAPFDNARFSMAARPTWRRHLSASDPSPARYLRLDEHR